MALCFMMGEMRQLIILGNGLHFANDFVSLLEKPTNKMITL